MMGTKNYIEKDSDGFKITRYTMTNIVASLYIKDNFPILKYKKENGKVFGYHKKTKYPLSESYTVFTGSYQECLDFINNDKLSSFPNEPSKKSYLIKK